MSIWSAEYADILQIGTRNMQNYDLLREVGKVKTPVMLKRGMSAKIEEWLQAAEYILLGGNPERHALRARHPHLRDLHAQHAGSLRGSRHQRTVAPACHR